MFFMLKPKLLSCFLPKTPFLTLVEQKTNSKLAKIYLLFVQFKKWAEIRIKKTLFSFFKTQKKEQEKTSYSLFITKKNNENH